MLDKEIRNSLVLFLKESDSKIKVFNEVKIGSSIADLMIVSNKIRGYEIKSDGDNYERLRNQIDNYNKFFDENYIVVGRTHKDSAYKNVPFNWGIICIDDTGMEVIRKAIGNNTIPIDNMLNLLWDLEVKEIVLENNLPIINSDDINLLKDLIKRELTYDEIHDAVKNELLSREETFSLKSEKIISSEDELINILQNNDITLDEWISVFTEAKKSKNAKNKRIEELKSKQESVDSDLTEIDFNLGSPFIKPYVIDEFISYLSNTCLLYPITKYDTSTGIWSIDGYPYKNNMSINYVYGMPLYNGIRLIENILNNREIIAYKTVDYKRVVDNESTVTLLDKAKLINAKFKEWVCSRKDIINSIRRQFHKLLDLPKLDKVNHDKLVFDNISKDFSLYDYQIEAINKIIDNDNTLLAFDVGSGKTAIMVAAAMKLRQMGISRKNMFVVPNSIVSQWEKMFIEIFPKARVLAISPKDFIPSKRSKVINMIRENDYDGIIIAYSCFDLIPLSAEYKLQELNSALESLQKGIQPVEFLNSKSSCLNIVKKINLMIESLKQDALLNSKDMCFDRLGVNTLFIDEAHNYKNLPIETSMKNLLGFNLKGSPKCKDLLDKIRCVQKENGGRGTVFATGTPLSNSIGDVYNMQVYLQPETLAKCGIIRFDDWVKTFSVCEDSFELDVTGIGYRNVKRFKKFINLDVLSNIFSKAVIYYAKKDLDKLPLFRGYTDEILDRSENLNAYMEGLAKRADNVRNKKVDKAKDNMLKISIDGRKAALDLRLVDKISGGERLSKCAENVYKLYMEDNFSTQIIFSDYSTPKDSFNVYDELKKLLIYKGVKDNEIVFIHDYENETSRLKLFSDINNSKIRIIIGSTFKLGIGVNIQKKLKAIHHLDVPWRPADMVQREGRIIRPGNEQDEIKIYRYITIGSFDSYSWQILENKQRFISQFLSGTGYQKNIEDLEENVLSFAEAKALALNEPLIKKIAETENEISRIKILQKQSEKQRLENIEKVGELKSKLKQNKINYAFIKYNYSRMNSDGEEKLEKLKCLIDKYTPVEKNPYEFRWFDGENILDICSLHIKSPCVWTDKKYCVFVGDSTYDGNPLFVLELGDSASGNVTRIKNFLNGMVVLKDKLEDEIQSEESQIDFLTKEIKNGTKYDLELIELNEALDELKKSV